MHFPNVLVKKSPGAERVQLGVRMGGHGGRRTAHPVRLCGSGRVSLALRPGQIVMLVILLAGAFPGVLQARDGRALFEEGYRVEKSQPERAASLYRSALEAGLAVELAKAARWRLFFLCREQGWYLEAFEVLKALSHKESIEDALLDDVRSQWGLKREEFLSLHGALRELRKRATPGERELQDLRKAYGAASNRGKREIDRWLKERGQEAILVQLAAGDRNLSETETAIRGTSYWIDRGEPTKARAALEPQLKATSLTRDEKARLLYLLGRLERLEENPDAAVAFRIACNYASGKERDRLTALAAFNLYREGQAEQAWALARRVRADSVDDAGMELFLTVLEADVRGDAGAMARLRSQEKSIRRQEKGFLTAKALEVLGRVPTP